MQTNSEPNPEIRSELYRTLVLLGADNGLLGTIGSWGDSLPDDDVLANLKRWNEGTLTEITARIAHYEISCPHPARIRAEGQRTVDSEQQAS